ncbi:hypothetical protein BP5796_11194 [Coleophoma crateriformis]|uniref:Luciferase-like domain-containing protein n=1 Tax=Coleophoma crateriformis TaxID=565419 RepID=A0A3D8QHJ5_9HELO|nr:hypothetical protein BP5796_11194 [Coleophoma crateriformis]
MGSEAPTKRILLNFFEKACAGNHMSPGQWKDPKDTTTSKDRLPYWLNLARLADEGKISCIFFADGYSTHEVYGGNSDPMFRAGTQAAALDPMVLIPAMASVTKNVAFGVTGSTSYLNPYILARTMSSLDHLTDGRVAWNIVTSWSKGSADALGADDVVPHDERYEIAEEYMDLCYKLWEGSWADDAVIHDIETSTAWDPKKIKKIVHKGKYFNCDSRYQTHPSPQRTPLLFQAGASKAGRSFASKHAEAIYLGGLLPSSAAASVKQIRDLAVTQGRDPSAIKFFSGISPIIGQTMEEALEKYERARKNADIIGGLAQFSGYTGIDMSTLPLDEPFSLDDTPGKHAIHGAIDAFNAASKSDSEKSEVWTPRKLGEKMALGGFHPAPVGTPEMVADVFEQWVREADIDGFNISYTTAPESFEDVVYLLRPELVKRGLMWEDYDVPGGTARENLYGKNQIKLRSDHYGSQFFWKPDEIIDSEVQG